MAIPSARPRKSVDLQLGWEAIGSIIVRPVFLGLLSEAQTLKGDLEEALGRVDEASHSGVAQ